MVKACTEVTISNLLSYPPSFWLEQLEPVWNFRPKFWLGKTGDVEDKDQVTMIWW